jgi:hypothetical protein
LGYYLVNSANPSCSPCPNNCNYCADGICNSCIDTTNYIFINTANSISCATIISANCKSASASICTACNDGYYLDNSNPSYPVCTSCSSNCGKCTDGSHCISCKDQVNYVVVDKSV